MDDHKKAGTSYQNNHSHLLTPCSPTSSPSTSLSSLQIASDFESLPLDVLLYILSYLSPKQLLKLSCTSQKCKGIIWNATLWHTIKIDDSGIDGKEPNDLLPFEYFKKINAKLLSFIKEISVVEATCRNFGDGRQFARSLLWMCKKCTSLQKLQLDWCASLLNDDIVSFTQEGIHLLHLSLTFNPILVSDIGITLLARLGLERLDLSLFKNITEKGLCEFIGKCKSIRRLTVDTCGCIDSEALDSLKRLYPNVRITIPSDDEDEDFVLPEFEDDEDVPSEDEMPTDDSDNNFFYNNNSDDDDDDSEASESDSDIDSSGRVPIERNGTGHVVPPQITGHPNSDIDDSSNDEDFRPSSDNEEEESAEPDDDEEEEEDSEDTQRDETVAADEEDTEKEEEP